MARVSAVPDSEWVVTVRFEHKGEPVGEWEGRYADSYAAPCPENVAVLMLSRLQYGIEQTRKKKGKK